MSTYYKLGLVVAYMAEMTNPVSTLTRAIWSRDPVRGLFYQSQDP